MLFRSPVAAIAPGDPPLVIAGRPSHCLWMKKVAIVGASGYSGEELVRLLLSHPHIELVAVTSRQSAGQTVAQVFPKFASHPGSRSLRFSEPNAEVLARQAEIVFLALPHGVAAEFAVPLVAAGCTVIDLSADFRLKSAAEIGRAHV